MTNDRSRATALLVSIVLLSSACNNSPPEETVYVEGVIWYSSHTCEGTHGMLTGSKLIFTDSLGGQTEATQNGGPCGPDYGLVDELIPRRNSNVITSGYFATLPRSDTYDVAFLPGPEYGNRQAPEGPQDVSLPELEASRFRMDFDAGDDSGAESVSGQGVVIGPRACVGFPAPGCAP